MEYLTGEQEDVPGGGGSQAVTEAEVEHCFTKNREEGGKVATGGRGRTRRGKESNPSKDDSC